MEIEVVYSQLIPAFSYD